MKIAPLSEWIPHFSEPLIIAGPCSAESESQVVSTAVKIKEMGGCSVFRAGLWKPRTRPNSFAGVGAQGLSWLIKAKKESGLLVATEVASAEHVQLACEAGIDVLWIGARTTANPFSVAEIAKALRNYNVPVMVKNPTSTDLSLWIGALERLADSGIEKLVAIHRGFTSLGGGRYRNNPHWKLAIELAGTLPNLPVISDPSHIGGSRELIAEISQKAIDRGMKGLMIETHPDPDNALSDAKQQITPEMLSTILQGLSYKGEFSEDERFLELINDLRIQIDRIDHDLIDALGERMRISELIGKEKSMQGVTPFQMRRLQELMSDRIQYGANHGLEEKFIKELFNIIHVTSVNAQS